MASTITADTGAVSGSAGLKSSADSSGVLALATGTGTTAVTINTSQNVGVGTSSPKTRLQSTAGTNLNAPSLGSATNAPFYLTNTDTGYGLLAGVSAGDGHAWLQPQRTDGTATAYNMTLCEAGGNVGIGTSSPASKVDLGATFYSGTPTTLAQLIPNLSLLTAAGVPTYGFGISSNALNITAGEPTGTIRFWTGGVNERMRIDSSGNMEIFSGAAWTSAGIGPTGKQLTLGYDTTNSIGYLRSANNGTAYTPLYLDGSIIRFGTGTGAIAEAARINSSGNLLVGTTSEIGGSSAFLHVINTDGGKNGIAVGNSTGSSATVAIRLLNSNGTVGSIITSGSATSFNTSSDYRLKHDIQPMNGALAKVQALKPVTYKWNADNSTSEGFIAHELAEVVPDCVTGEKDAVDAKGNPVYQGIDTSFLVATLTAAIQEQQAIIEQLKADVAELKAAK